MKCQIEETFKGSIFVCDEWVNSKLSQFFYFHNIHKQLTVFSLADIICQILLSYTCSWILWRDLFKPSTEQLLYVCETAQRVKLLHWMDECIISGQITNVDFNFDLHLFLWKKRCISSSLNFMFCKNQWYTAYCKNKKNTSKCIKWTFKIWFLFPFFKVMFKKIVKSNTD